MSGFDGNGYRALAGGERVDHAAEARDHLVRADKQGAGDEVGADLRMSALVHATLALVEQQRIANVIRLQSMPTEDYDRLAMNVSVIAIREGLGL